MISVRISTKEKKHKIGDRKCEKETIKNKNTITAMKKNTLEGITSRLDEAED